MRLVLVCALALSVAACDGQDTARLVSADVTDGGDDGCMVGGQEAPGAPRRWKVRDGDSLRRIARRCYGDENLWKAIRDANPDAVGPRGEIRTGAVLVVPYDGI